MNRTPSEQIIESSYQVTALLTLCECAAWSMRNNMADIALVSDSVHTALLMAKELHASVHDFLEVSEGLKEVA